MAEFSGEVPTLSLYPYLPGDVELPYPSAAHLGDSTPSSVTTTLSGAFETIQSSQGDGRTWTFGWDALTMEQYQGLERLSKARAVFLRDPLGRRCLVQIQEFRPSVTQQEFDVQGRQMYAANVDALVLAAGHLPWCPSFKAPAVTVGTLRGYGRRADTDPLGDQNLVYTNAAVAGQFLRMQGGSLESLGPVVTPPPYDWDRTVRQGSAGPPAPITYVSGQTLSDHAGSVFFAFETAGPYVQPTP